MHSYFYYLLIFVIPNTSCPSP